MADFDFIIVGAGSAGCVLAEKLSADPAHSVLVVEAGGPDDSFWIRTPIGYGRTFADSRVNWMYRTERDPQTGDRSSYWPRGKVVGGSGSINALVYCRGLPHDFDDWAAAGAQGWNWNAVRPHFEALECHVDADGTVRGTGPFFVSDVARETHPSNRHYFDMAREMGLPITDDCNGEQPEGVTRYHITTRKGRRWSSADAFLRPALKRANVTLVTHAMVERILIEKGRATGISVRLKTGTQLFRARREVVLSAGSVNSPQLLQLSGIGPGAVLRAAGIQVVFANDNVGANLQDHLGINYYFKATEPTLNSMLSPWWGKLFYGAQYLLTRRGPLSISVNQCGGFVRSRVGLGRPDTQLYLNPVSYYTGPTEKRRTINPDPFPGFILSFQPSRPTSRGSIAIGTPDPLQPPRIVPNYLSTERDLQDAVSGGRLIQTMTRTAAMRGFTKEPIAPDIGPMDDGAILEDFRARCGSVYHPVASCRMGSSAATAVVDSRLKVFGIDGLRVVDASVFPNITSGNTNAPTLMVAHKGAGLILADHPK